MSDVRVGIDATSWTNRRGFGRFTRNAVRALVARHPSLTYDLYVDDRSDPEGLPEGARTRVVALSRAPSEAAAADSNRSVADLLRLTRAVRGDHPDVFLFPSLYTWFPVPGIPTVVGLHDTIADDLPELTLPSRRARLLWRVKQRLALRSAAQVFTVSDASRAAIARRHGLAPEELPVVPEAPDPVFTTAAHHDGGAERIGRLGLSAGGYLLYAGGISPHKNVDGLVNAYASVVAQRPDAPPLVLVGDLETETYASAAGAVRERIAAHGLGDRVRLPGFVPDELLAALYAGATLVTVPSLAEGFGLPAVEAAACGAPLVLSDLPSHRASLGDGALYVPPGDTQALAAAIERSLADPALRRDLAARARKAVAGRTWDGAADELERMLRGAARG